MITAVGRVARVCMGGVFVEIGQRRRLFVDRQRYVGDLWALEQGDGISCVVWCGPGGQRRVLEARLAGAGPSGGPPASSILTDDQRRERLRRLSGPANGGA